MEKNKKTTLDLNVKEQEIKDGLLSIIEYKDDIKEMIDIIELSDRYKDKEYSESIKETINNNLWNIEKTFTNKDIKNLKKLEELINISPVDFLELEKGKEILNGFKTKYNEYKSSKNYQQNNKVFIKFLEKIDLSKKENINIKIAALFDHAEKNPYFDKVQKILNKKSINSKILKYKAIADLCKRSETTRQNIINNLHFDETVKFTDYQAKIIKQRIFKINDVESIKKSAEKRGYLNYLMKTNIISGVLKNKLCEDAFEKKGTPHEKDINPEFLEIAVKATIEKNITKWLNENESLSFIKTKNIEKEFNEIFKKKLPGYYKAFNLLKGIEQKPKKRIKNTI